MSSSTARRLALASTALASAGLLSAPAQSATCNWAGGAGSWYSGAQWSCGAQPGSGDDAVITASGSVVTINSGTANAGTISVGMGNSLTATNDATLYIYNNALTNNGTITVSDNSDFRSASGTINVTGTGSIVLDSSMVNSRLFGGGWSFGSGQTVSGTGQIGIDQTIITNAGVISANVNGGNLSLDATGGNGGLGGAGVGTGSNASLYNTGTLQATNGGTLSIEGGLYENSTSGVVRADSGSSVNLDNDSRIVGGTLTSVGTGAINAAGGNQYLTSVTLSAGSHLNDTAGGTVFLNTSFINNGTLTINNNSDLRSESGTLSITGTGTITLGTSPTNRIFNGNITFGSGQTVQGVGQLGIDRTIVTNNGLITANVSGGTLSVNATGGNAGLGGAGVGTNGNASLLNNATIQAVNGGNLSIEGGLYENASGGVIQALAGSTVSLDNDSRIVGGTLTSVGTGAINGAGGNQYLTNVTLSAGSHLNDSAGGTLLLNTSFVNNGTLTINNNSDLRSESGMLSITGTGTITLGTSPTNRIFDGNITFGSGQTVQGVGQLGIDRTIVTNNGLITANVSGSTLSVDATGGNGGLGGAGVGTNGNASLLNNTTMQAVNGANLSIEGGLYENASGGVIQALAGSTVSLNGDTRILNGTLTSVGTGAINVTGGSVYLTNVTLSSGTTTNVTSDNTLYLNTSLVNNGTLTINNNSDLRTEASGALSITGNGTIVLGANPTNRIFDGNITIGNGQLITGQGQIGLDRTLLSNSGNILANGNLFLDVTGGSTGLGGAGVGTGGNAGFYNANGGQLQANNGGSTLTVQGGLYEQAAGGSFSVGSGSTFIMNGDSSLTNLQSGGVLNKGLYFAFDNGTMTLQSNQTTAIQTIGTDHAGIDTTVSLTGPNSTIQIEQTGGGTATTIDQSLQSIAQSGELILAGGRSFTAANGGFTNAGELSLQNGTFTAPAGFTNSGLVTGNGTVGTAITNTGTVVADGGTLHSQAITGTTGTIQSNAGATLDLSGAGATLTAAFLTNNGNLSLGTNSITVTSDYQNANFGSGNAFNAHANVTGSGTIDAASATMDLSGSGLSGNTLNVGNVRLGNSSSTTLTITNNGTLTTLRGAVESPTSNTVGISSSNFVVGPNGGSTSVTLSYTGTTAGSLSGNTVTVANNFDNVADRTLTITGAAYNPAAASLSPNPVDLGATRVGGTALSGSVTIANTAPSGAYSEKLAVTSATGSGGAMGSAPAGLINPGSSTGSTVTIGTGTSGNFQGSVTYGLATDGTGTSGLAQLALPSQTVAVNGRVYQTANAQLGATTVDFGTVRQGTGSTNATLGVTNAASGALTDSLNTSVGAVPTGVTGSAPGALAGGATGNATFSHSNATAGVVSGTGTLNFTSTDAELTPLALASQNVNFTGTVTQLAIADLFKNSGAGTFTGSGNTYTLNLGSFTGSGSAMANLGVLNGNAGAAYSEALGGTYAGAAASGYTFAGMTFSDLAGGDSDIGNLLTFDYAGLADGTYTDTLTFNGYSSYAGLANFTLSPITVNVTATVTGSGMTAAVPEPATWAMVILGFGFAGGSLRRRRLASQRRGVA